VVELVAAEAVKLMVVAAVAVPTVVVAAVVVDIANQQPSQ